MYYKQWTSTDKISALIKLQQFTEALSDPSFSLTYPALIGLRIQFVVDAKCLFGPKLAAFMEWKRL